MMKVCWPMAGAVHGVAGARIASTLSKQLEHLALIPAAEFLRVIDQRRRDHGAGDQPVAHRGDRNRGARAQTARDAGSRLRSP